MDGDDECLIEQQQMDSYKNIFLLGDLTSVGCRPKVLHLKFMVWALKGFLWSVNVVQSERHAYYKTQGTRRTSTVPPSVPTTVTRSESDVATTVVGSL